MSKALFASVMATAMLALAGFAAPEAFAQAPPSPKVSEANAKALKEAQDALTARKYADAVAKSRSVLAGSKKTKDDTYVAYHFLFEVAKAQNNNSGMMEALEGQVASGFLPPSAEATITRALTGLAYQQRDYKKAIEYGQQLIRSGNANPDIYQWVGQAYYQLRNYDEAVRFFTSLVNEKEKRGQRPDRNELVLLQSAQDKAGNKDAAQTTLEKIVRYYPDANTWLALLYDVKKERLDPRQKLHTYRLMDVTGNLKHAQDFSAYSEAATSLGLPAESLKALDAGLGSNVFPAGPDKDRAERYRKSEASRAEGQKGEMAKLETEARAAPTGNEYVALGMALYSIEQYGRAVDALKAGLSKGGVKYPGDAQLTLGEAQLKAGQKSDALKTFRAVESEDEITLRIAKLWALYAS